MGSDRMSIEFIGKPLTQISDIVVGGKVTFTHPGHKNGDAYHGLPGITVGKEYTAESIRQIGDAYWIKITCDDGKKYEYRSDLF